MGQTWFPHLLAEPNESRNKLEPDADPVAQVWHDGYLYTKVTRIELGIGLYSEDAQSEHFSPLRW